MPAPQLHICVNIHNPSDGIIWGVGASAAGALADGERSLAEFQANPDPSDIDDIVVLGVIPTVKDLYEAVLKQGGSPEDGGPRYYVNVNGIAYRIGTKQRGT